MDKIFNYLDLMPMEYVLLMYGIFFLIVYLAGNQYDNK